MNKRYLVVGAAVALPALIAAAFVLDCVRLAEAARHRVDLADEELAKHEQRLVKLLGGSATVAPEVEEAIAAHKSAATPKERHDAYDQLVAAFRRTTPSEVDPTNTLDRKFMDDVAGAINRREIAEKPYDAELDVYRAYISSPRGSVARWFSSSALDAGERN